MDKKEFTIADAIKIQRAHLTEWESVLKPEIFEKLKEWAVSENDTKENPYDIVRGQSLGTYIQNYLMTKVNYL